MTIRRKDLSGAGDSREDLDTAKSANVGQLLRPEGAQTDSIGDDELMAKTERMEQYWGHGIDC